MKNMLRYRSFPIGLLFILVCAGLLACSEEGYESRIRELILEDLSFDNGQSSQELVFRHEDLSPYECASSEDWCKVSIDVPNRKITVQVTANDTYDPRTAVITVADKNNAEKRTFNVSQKRNTGLFIGETDFQVPMEGGSVTVSLESNVNYEVVIPGDCDWLSLATDDAKSRGLEESSFTLKVDANKSYNNRSAIVKVVNTDENLSGSVSVSQSFDTVFKVDSTDFEIPMDGGTFTVNVESNVSYEVKLPEDCDWITPSIKKKDPDFKTEATEIVFTVKENTGYDARDAIITLVNEHADIATPLTVHQPFTAVFKADKKTFEVPMEGGTVTVNMESNVSYDVSIPDDCDWVTLPSSSRTRGVKPSVVTLEVKENKSYHDRKVVVTIANKDAGVSVPITIDQPFNTIFTADKTAFDIDMAGGTITVNLQTNISYDVKIPEDCDWITLPVTSKTRTAGAQAGKAKKSRGATTEAIVLRVKENPGYKDRDAVVTIGNKDAGAEIKISVHQPFTTIFKADKTAFDVDMAGGTISINMESNISYDVTIPAGCDWITMPTAARKQSKTRGTVTSAVVLRVKENTSYQDREAVITISNKEAGVSIAVYIHQPFATQFKVDKNEFEVPMEGGTVTVNVESNIGFDVSIPSNCDWITQSTAARSRSKTRGTTTTAVVLSVKENTSYQDREAVVTIANKEAGVSVGISIRQPFATVFKVDNNAFEVPMKGGTVTANVESNVSYDVKIPSDCNWITQVGSSRTRGTRSSVVVLRVDENKSGSDRSAVVTIGNSSAGVSSGITITQPFTTSFKVDETPLEVDELGGTLGVNVAANVSVDVKPQVNWLKAGGKTGIGDGYWTQQIVVSPFTSKTAQRNGSVRFLYAAGNQSFTVAVTQNRTLYIAESDITLTKKGQTQALTLTNSKAAAVKWSSSNTAVATVSSTGTVTAVANGKAVITVMSTANSQYTDKVNIVVNIPSSSSPSGGSK